ncbi:T9SS type A sorting domain-containing protein [Ichthyenterobacterium sp. W332]|uniref:T9SS type A sorting domain-containing protein n=1 Tax=Microcosmobacter mediterraneus TaxID=3075607 RepID=A0ABU2YPK5_9FLAO|nr:T9SS type A sorting domain-containing protein [Ichthyenterobacterium sp. W332]MDT0559180.1 T9SS type A sorting domain-containing protein [Ichthyenterobacterium sp. W332]
MLRSILSLLVLLFFNSKIQSQSLDWAGQFSSEDGVDFADMYIDNHGNIYHFGTLANVGSAGTADFNPGSGVFNLTGFSYVTKLDELGNFIWAKTFDGFSPEHLVVDSFDNVILGFSLNGTVDLDPGPDVQNFTANGTNDIVIVKLDSEGNFVEANQIGGSNLDTVNAISIDDDGSIYATGLFSETVDFNPNVGTANLTVFGSRDIYVLKLDSNLEFVWVKQFGGTGFDYSDFLVIDDNGGIYFAGEFSGVADFDPASGTTNLTSQGSLDIFLCKLDTSGNLLWAGNLGSDDFQVPYDLQIDNNGSVYLSGSFTGTGDFDPSSAISNLTSTGTQDVFITKITEDTGSLVWARRLGGNGSTNSPSLKIDNQGNVFTAGGFSGTTDFDPSSEVLELESTDFVDFDIFISMLDAGGNYQCAKVINAPATQLPYELLPTNSGKLLMSGIFEGTVDFDPGPDITNLTNIGNSAPLSNNEADVFIVQLSIEACPNLSITENNFEDMISIYPNPVKNLLTIDLKQLQTKVDLRVLDLGGREVLSKSLLQTDKILLPTDMSAGIYLLEIEIEGYKEIFKILKD